MGLLAWNVYFTFRCLLKSEAGQDLVEYTLIVALIALAVTAGMESVAAAISSAFVHLGDQLIAAVHRFRADNE